jgi:hypothetical protein
MKKKIIFHINEEDKIKIDNLFPGSQSCKINNLLVDYDKVCNEKKLLEITNNGKKKKKKILKKNL